MKKLLMSFLIVGLFVVTLTGCGSKSKDVSSKKKVKEEKIKITEAATSKIEYEDYDNGLIKILDK